MEKELKGDKDPKKARPAAVDPEPPVTLPKALTYTGVATGISIIVYVIFNVFICGCGCQ